MFVYSYKKHPGWFPSGNGWSRLHWGIQVWDSEEEAEHMCPLGCEVVWLQIDYTEYKGYKDREKGKHEK